MEREGRAWVVEADTNGTDKSERNDTARQVEAERRATMCGETSDENGYGMYRIVRWGRAGMAWDVEVGAGVR